VASLRGAALRCRGVAEGDAGLLGDAAAVLADSPRPLERAQACEDAAEALGFDLVARS